MNKNLLTLMMLLALGGCESSDSGEQGSDNSPATFGGVSTADVSNLLQSSIQNTLTVSDADESESVFNALTNVVSDYGTFSINAAGEWTYTLDTTNTDVSSLVAGQTLTDTITISSADGTETSINIVITGEAAQSGDSNQVGKITDTTTDDAGELRYDITDAIPAGKITLSFLKEDGSTADAFISLFGTSTTTSHALVDLRIKEGRFEVRDQDDVDVETEFSLNEWVDVEISWDTANSAAAPAVDITIDGEQVDSFLSASSDLSSLASGVSIVTFKLGDSGSTPSGAFYIDDFKLYNGTTLVFEDDFSSYAENSALNVAPYDDEKTNEAIVVNFETESLSDGSSSDNNDNDGDSDNNDNDDNSDNDDNNDNNAVVIDPNEAMGFDASEGGNHLDGYTDAVPTVNCTQTVSSISALEDAAEDLQAGDTLCLADGTYTGGMELSVEGQGTSDAPITVAAQNPGQAIISGGESYARLGGKHIVLQGFVFRDGQSGSSIIKFEKNSECYYCRVTEVSVIDMDGGDFGSSKWVEYYGQYNRIDHSWFSGKESRGALLVLPRWTSESDFNSNGFPEDRAQIDYNYFGDRPPAWGRGYAGSSDNEYEGVRLGLSTTHSAPSYSALEYNYFERIQGEAEVISNKSANNSIRYNTVRDSNGSIVTRHGANADISHNFVFGDDNPFSGGIRLVDDGHIVTNNYVEGARFLSSNWNGGIVLTTGDGAGDTDNGYQDVENVLVAHNTIVDSVNSLNVSGGRNSNAPSNIYFVNNIIADAVGDIIRTNDEGMPSSSTFAGNYVDGQSFADEDSLTSYSGITVLDPELSKDDEGLYRPGDSVDLTADSTVSTGSFTLPAEDMDGQTRSSVTTSGADETLSTSISLAPLTSDDVGPKNYRPAPGKVYVQKVDIANHDFDSGDLTGWSGVGASVTNDVDEVFSRGNSLKIEGASSGASQVVALEANTNYTLSAFTKGTALLQVTLNDGTVISSETDNSSYKFTSVTFNSGTSTDATIVAALPDTLPVKADITNADFADDLNDWVVIENSDVTDGLGDVGDSSDSAVSGSRAAKFNYRYANDNNSTPGLYQDVTVLPNTDYNLSMYVLVKSAASGTTATFGVKDPSDGSILYSKVADYDALKAAGAPEGTNKEHYQDVLSFNTGDATSVRIYAEMDAQSMDASHIPADSTTQMADADRKIYEVRVDDFELSYEAAPPADSEAFFDSIRLVSHPLSAAESDAAEND